MKELSIKEKAEHYDKAINAIKKLKAEHPTALVIKDWINENFPELAESEDEKIRKALIEMAHDAPNNLMWSDYGIRKKDAITWLENQGENSAKWSKNTKDCKPQKNHSVLMKTTHGIAEGEWQGEQWHQYRWASSVKDTDVLSWMELSNLEKQREEKPLKIKL